MQLMQACQSFRIERNRQLKPGDTYYCTEAVARHHEAMGCGIRVTGVRAPVQDAIRDAIRPAETLARSLPDAA